VLLKQKLPHLTGEVFFTCPGKLHFCRFANYLSINHIRYLSQSFITMIMYVWTCVYRVFQKGWVKHMLHVQGVEMMKDVCVKVGSHMNELRAVFIHNFTKPW